MGWRDDIDRPHMERALELATRGAGATRPNPLVGAVLARGGDVLAEGWHARYGEAHAERALLDSFAEPVPEDATLYVTLEPCAHHGKQPPCADLVVERGVRRVVIASHDPSEKTAGKGPALLEAAGVELVWAPRDVEERALAMNSDFRSVHLRGRPWVTAKWAMTSNGRFATGDPGRRWVSSGASREIVHHMRALNGAVLTGIGTVLEDDPMLTVRGTAAETILSQPLRVVYDRNLRIPITSKLVEAAREVPVLVFASPSADAGRRAALESRGVEVVAETDLRESLGILAARGVNSALLEAGPELLTAFHVEGLIDLASWFVAPFDAPESQPGLDPDHPLRQLADGRVPADVDGDQSYVAFLTNPADLSALVG